MDAVQRAANQLFLDVNAATAAADDFHAWPILDAAEAAAHYAHVVTIRAFRQDLKDRRLTDPAVFVERHRALVAATKALTAYMDRPLK